MHHRQLDDSQIEQIADLPIQKVGVRDAAHVKGGFNPQPDPPKIGIVFQPPVFVPIITIGPIGRP